MHSLTVDREMNLLSLVSPWLDNIYQIKSKMLPYLKKRKFWELNKAGNETKFGWLGLWQWLRTPSRVPSGGDADGVAVASWVLTDPAPAPAQTTSSQQGISPHWLRLPCPSFLHVVQSSHRSHQTERSHLFVRSSIHPPATKVAALTMAR